MGIIAVVIILNSILISKILHLNQLIYYGCEKANLMAQKNQLEGDVNLTDLFLRYNLSHTPENSDKIASQQSTLSKAQNELNTITAQIEALSAQKLEKMEEDYEDCKAGGSASKKRDDTYIIILISDVTLLIIGVLLSLNFKNNPVQPKQ